MFYLNLAQKEEIVSQAKQALPHEACGILAGRGKRVEKIYKMKNTASDPAHCYFMDPKEQLKIIKEMRGLGLEMLGIYHTHPDTEAYPSPRDIELSFYPEVLYIIVSLQKINDPAVRAFRIVEGEISEEEISYESKTNG